MYHTYKVYIKDKNSDLYKYCATQARAANNLRNAALFRCRQVLTMFDKPDGKMTANEKEIYEEIKNALPNMNHKFDMPKKGKTYLSYMFLENLFRATDNPDFMHGGLPMQSAQNIVSSVEEEMKGFYASIRAYKEDCSKFNGRPKLPKYGKSGGLHTVEITNQDAVIYKNADGTHYLKLPKTKERLNLGHMPIIEQLKQVDIIPTHGVFLVALTFETHEEEKPFSDKPRRIANIDLGVNNFAAITNNIGKPCLLFKGGVVKSANQYYNKKTAEIRSQQTKGGSDKFVPTPESEKLDMWRENFMYDIMHKYAKCITMWCVDNDIDTVVVGENKGWKQNLNMNKTNNQNFIYIPFNKFKDMFSYLCEDAGIRVLFVEESYTSKASFLDNDMIPSYGDKDIPGFSGKRSPKYYNTDFGQKHKKDGFRGLYTSANGTVINSDLNASANIGRKYFPDMYETGKMPDFGNVIVIKHPDYDAMIKNKKKQHEQNQGISKSKQKRLNRKSNVTQ